MQDDEAVFSARDVSDSGCNDFEGDGVDRSFGSDNEVTPWGPEDGVDVVVAEDVPNCNLVGL